EMTKGGGQLLHPPLAQHRWWPSLRVIGAAFSPGRRQADDPSTGLGHPEHEPGTEVRLVVRMGPHREQGADVVDLEFVHVLLVRGRLAERWRSERWDSLRLLTPNWATRLPGWSYDGGDPDGYMTAGELVSYFESYAGSFAPPVQGGQRVRALGAVAGGFSI